jgi:hypothetical protein
MSVSHTSVRSTSEPRAAARKGAHVGALWGLAARGVLYVLLAVLALELVVGSTRGDVDTRGALHRLAHDSLGSVVLVVLAIGFAAFAIWHAYVALRGSSRDDTSRRLADAGRAIVYALLCALAISFLLTSKQDVDGPGPRLVGWDAAGRRGRRRDHRLRCLLDLARALRWPTGRTRGARRRAA